VKYARLLEYVGGQPWAIHPAKLSEILEVLAFRAAGHEFTPTEIAARIGGAASPTGLGRASGGVAVIPIRGVIAHRMGGMRDSSGGTSTEAIAQMFRQAQADTSIGSILFDVDSPGGTVTGCMELAAEIFAARGRKRVTAISNGTCASAAYWIASQADEIVSIPSGETGSIGVVFPHQDLSAALEKQGVKVTVFRAGLHKWEGNAWEPLSEQAAATIQKRVNDVYAQFVSDVARGRRVTTAVVRNGYGEGRLVDAKAAKAAGLIDRIATVDATIGGSLGGRTSAGALRASADDDEVRRRRMVKFGADDDQRRRMIKFSDDEADRLRRMEKF